MKRLVRVHVLPISDILAGHIIPAGEMVIDVIEAFAPGTVSGLFDLDRGLAEPTPKPSFAILSYATGFNRIFYSLLIGHAMSLHQMRLERLAPI